MNKHRIAVIVLSAGIFGFVAAMENSSASQPSQRSRRKSFHSVDSTREASGSGNRPPSSALDGRLSQHSTRQRFQSVDSTIQGASGNRGRLSPGSALDDGGAHGSVSRPRNDGRSRSLSGSSEQVGDDASLLGGGQEQVPNDVGGGSGTQESPRRQRRSCKERFFSAVLKLCGRENTRKTR